MLLESCQVCMFINRTASACVSVDLFPRIGEKLTPIVIVSFSPRSSAAIPHPLITFVEPLKPVAMVEVVELMSTAVVEVVSEITHS